MKYLKLKNDIKALVITIKELKSHLKQDNRSNWNLWDLQEKIRSIKFHLRYLHVTYCLLRGRSYEEIEKPAEDNKINWNYIEKYKEKYNEKDVCPCT